MKDQLAALVATQLKGYRAQPARMVSDYNRERQLASEYNGRQILEMLQNADDEESDAVLISLDEVNGILTIANRGAPFTVEGFESLMLANLSSKTKPRYIGNKGLGFRSIVYWAHRITIDSGTVSVTFSEAFARQTFERLFDSVARARIRQERDLGPETVPVAFLAVPEFGDRTGGGWTTKISVHYRPGFLDGIREQLAGLQAECLLFLKHIGSITVVLDGKERRFEKAIAGDIVTINGEAWTIRPRECPLPPGYQNSDRAEQEWYSLKLALSDGLKKGAPTLYTFFPTKVNIDFPMVIHGTFDLDSSRNQLVQSDRNRFLLTELVDLIMDTARSLRGQENDPWAPVRLLRYRDSNPVLGELDFYRQIAQGMRDLEIFPCVDGTYRRASEVYYLGDAFSRLVVLAGCKEEFPGLVCPGEENLVYRDRYRRIAQVAGFAGAVNRLSECLLGHDLEHRVTLIRILCSDAELAGSYSLLVDDRNGLIDAGTDAYTPLTAGTDAFAIPDFVNIAFIGQRLFGLLADRLEADPREKARDIQRRLKTVTTIHSYEPAQVFRSIIRSATAALGRPAAGAQAIIGEMVSALLASFSALGEPAALPQDVSVRLLNARLEVTDARELFLSSGYPTGTHTARIFARVHGQGQFLAPPAAFGAGAAAADPAMLERLFLWLGVNRFVRYVTVKEGPPLRDDARLRAYESFVLGVAGRPVSYREAAVECLAIREQDLDRMLGAMSREELVEWLIRDPDARSRLAPDNPDVFGYAKVNEKAGSAYHRLPGSPSFLHFQLRSAAIFDGFLLDGDVPAVGLVNPFAFGFSAPCLAGSGAGRREIETVLLKLGAKERFDELPLDVVANLLRRLPELDPQGARTQRLYRLALTHHDVHRQALPPDVPLFAYVGKEGRYFPQGGVYYSDNIRLPRKIVNRYPVFDFPRRGGGEKVAAFFRVQSLNDIPIHVHEYTPVPGLAGALASTLREKLPFVLAYRIHDLQEPRKVEAARLLKKLSIVPCADITCEVGGESFPLSENDYVRYGAAYLVRVDPVKPLQDLTRDPLFCDMFADIVGSIFAVSDHRAEIRGVLKDPLDEVEHLANSELGEDAVREARQLLGLADPATAFWAALWGASHGCAPENLPPDGAGILLGQLLQHGIDPAGLDFERISASENVPLVTAVFRALGVPVDAFNRLAVYRLDLTEHHRRKLADRQHHYFGAFASSLWARLASQDWSARARFLGLLADYEDRDWTDSAAAAHGRDPEPDYDAIVLSRIGSGFDGLVLSAAQDHEVFYRQQSQAFSTDELKSLAPAARSFLYFEGGHNRVRETAFPEQWPAPDQQGGPPAARKLPAQNSLPVALQPKSGHGKKRGGSYTHSPAQDEKNRASGEAAEQVVVASLVAAYGEEHVEHVAHRHDGAGYDIRYSPDRGTTWRYAEVKRYTQNCIHLSSNEYTYAAANRHCYELFLVSAADEIFCLTDIDFSDGERFGVVASEFVVSFMLKGGDAGQQHAVTGTAGAGEQASPAGELVGETG